MAGRERSLIILMPGQSRVLKGSDGVTPMWRALYELNLNKTTTF